MALRIDGRDDNLRRSYFLMFGTRFGVREAASVRILDELCVKATPWLSRLQEIGLPEKKTTFRATMEKRLRDLAG